MKNRLILLLPFLFFLALPTQMYAADSPMLSKYFPIHYEETGEKLTGVIPALDSDNIMTRPWELAQWKGIVKNPDGSTTSILNYDVFNVKKAEGDTNFDKENGFGLVYKSSNALEDLFDAFIKGNTKDISSKQLQYYRNTFSENANDESFKSGNSFYYKLEVTESFLRTAGIIQRMGYKFDQTKKISESERQAIYTASKWPELKVIQSTQSFSINYTTYGFTDRKVRIVATAKGSFPDLKRVVSLTDGKLISASKEAESGTVKVTDFDGLRKEFGDEVDIVLEDGYGRTAIQSLKLPTISNMDFIPTELSLTQGNQLWVKFKYQGDDFTTSDYVNERGIPMLAKVTITGPEGDSRTLQGMYTESSKKTTDGQTYAFYLGKIDIGEEAGRYKIKANVTINNPNHEDRALEYPAVAYENNSIDDEWTRDLTDLIAQSVDVDPDEVKEGNAAQVTAKVKNVGSVTQGNVLIRFYDNDDNIYEVRKTLPANVVTTVGPFTWKGEGEGNHNIIVEVDPQEQTNDIDYSNNIAIGNCLVIGNDSAAGSCSGPSISKDWSVTYPTITGYKTNSKGKKRPIWKYKKVNYDESLKLSADVNTKQGIATDPNNPKASDVDSRGSWEIIPWAKQNGKNPNQVTRAGYGFELKVKTDYVTDWETKIPKGYEGTAKAIGGKYYGPSEVTAYVYDTRNVLVKTIAMEKTGGDRNNAIWEFPKVTIQSDSGKSYTDRKFMTDYKSPDGLYKVKVVSSKAGKFGLSVCDTRTIEIYGSMYDDTQNLRTLEK